MAGATNGYLILPCGELSATEEMRAAPLPISGTGTSRAYGDQATMVTISRLAFARAGGFGGYGGNYKIVGTCQDAATLLPLQRRVYLFSPQGELLLADQYSDPTTGVFTFYNIALGTYTVEGWDQNLVQNNEVSALVISVPM
jgi:hypothetical protein